MKKRLKKWGAKESFYWLQKNWLRYLLFLSISLISTLILAILVGVKIIDWNWLTGQILGAFFALLAFWVANISLKILTKSENYYLYYFFYTLRLGLYVIPILLATLIPSSHPPFFWGGVLIGLIPVILTPFFQAWFLRKAVN